MKKKARLPRVKREIKDFLLSEEGKITKKNVAKMGMSLAILALMFKPQIVSAAHASHAVHSSHASHGNAFFKAGQGGHNSGGTTTGSTSHASHGSHGSHGQW